MEPKPLIPVMINDASGDMGSRVEAALSLRPEFRIIPDSLTGPNAVPWHKGKSGDIRLHSPLHHERIMRKISDDWGGDGLIVIDFTQPDGVEKNVMLYCANKRPFIMGTTGGKRKLLPQLVEASEISAVIATNMSAPVVMMMDIIMFAASTYPDTLKDWEIRIVESHQAKKRDISGTALSIGEIMKGLGVKFIGPENIRAIRDEIEQRLLGVPESYLGGHGWHKYELRSPDDNVMLGFEHNINGRDTYVEGTLKALDFLMKKIAEGSKGQCFSMPDVMRG